MANLQCQVDILSKAVVKQHINSENMNLNAVEQHYRYITYNGQLDPSFDKENRSKIKFDFTNYDGVDTKITNDLNLTFGKSLTNNKHKDPRYYKQKQDDTYVEDVESSHSSVLVHTDSDETHIDGYIIGTTKYTVVQDDPVYKCFNLGNKHNVEITNIDIANGKFNIDISDLYEISFDTITGNYSTSEIIMEGSPDDINSIIITYNISSKSLTFVITHGGENITFVLNDVEKVEESGKLDFTYGEEKIIECESTTIDGQINISVTTMKVTFDIYQIKTIDNSRSFTFMGENGEIISSTTETENEKEILSMEIDSTLDEYNQFIKVVDSNKNEYRDGDSSKAFNIIRLYYKKQ